MRIGSANQIQGEATNSLVRDLMAYYHRDERLREQIKRRFIEPLPLLRGIWTYFLFGISPRQPNRTMIYGPNELMAELERRAAASTRTESGENA